MMSKEAKSAIIAEGSFIEWLWQDSAGTLEKVKLIHRLDVRSEKQIHRQLLADLERVPGKMQILSQVAEVVVEHPN